MDRFPYACGYCKTSFELTFYLLKHLRDYHNESHDDDSEVSEYSDEEYEHEISSPEKIKDEFFLTMMKKELILDEDISLSKKDESNDKLNYQNHSPVKTSIKNEVLFQLTENKSSEKMIQDVLFNQKSPKISPLRDSNPGEKNHEAEKDLPKSSQENDLTKVQEKQFSWGCNICSMKFELSSDLKRHFQNSHPEGRSFSSVKNTDIPEDSSTLKKELSGPKGSPVKENARNKLFSGVNDPKRSLLKTENLKYEMEKFLQENQVKQVKKVAKKEIDFACGICSKKYLNKWNLHRHIRAIHVEGKSFSGQFPCSVCSKNFPYKANKERHEKKAHNVFKKVSSAKKLKNLKELASDITENNSLKEEDKENQTQVSFISKEKDSFKTTNLESTESKGVEIEDKLIKSSFTCDICFMKFGFKCNFKRHRMNVHNIYSENKSTEIKEPKNPAPFDENQSYPNQSSEKQSSEKQSSERKSSAVRIKRNLGKQIFSRSLLIKKQNNKSAEIKESDEQRNVHYVNFENKSTEIKEPKNPAPVDENQSSEKQSSEKQSSAATIKRKLGKQILSRSLLVKKQINKSAEIKESENLAPSEEKQSSEKQSSEKQSSEKKSSEKESSAVRIKRKLAKHILSRSLKVKKQKMDKNLQKRTWFGWFCDICSEKFQQKADLKQHESTAHPGVKPFLCNICHSSFRLEAELKHHYIKKHASKVKKPSKKTAKENVNEFCQICKKRFPESMDPIDHEKECFKSRPLPCKECPRRFLFKEHVTRHELHVHANYRPFGCSFCPKMFQVRANAQRHESQVHFSNRPYPCSFCPLMFKDNAHAKRHELTHLVMKKRGRKSTRNE